MVSASWWTGWAARRGPGSPFVNSGLFRAASLRTQRAPFSALGSPAIYAAFVTGVAWMAWWQGRQTTRVLRRLLAITASHAGWPGPGLPNRASLATWWTGHRAVPLAQLAPAHAEPVDQLLARCGHRDRNGVDDEPVLVSQERYPAEPCYQAPSCRRGDPGFEARSQPVWCLDLGLVTGRHLGHRGLVLCRQGLEHRRLGVPSQRVQPPGVTGEKVVADYAPVFRAVDPDDVVIAQVDQRGPKPGLAPFPVRGALGPD